MATAKQIGDNLRKTLALIAKELALQIDRNLRRRPSAGGTPVDTGHARRNWIPSVGAPHSGEVADESAHERGIADLIAYQLDKGLLWIANSVPYIRALNYGHSDQAPVGFIELAVAEAIETIADRWIRKGVDLSDLKRIYANAVGGDTAGNVASAYSPFGDDE